MATYTSTVCQTFSTTGFFMNPPKYIEDGVIVRSASFTFPVSASAGDVVQMVNVPKGCQILDVTLMANGGLATGTNVAFNVGDGAQTNRYIASASAAAGVGTPTSILLRANNGMGYSYSAEDTIDVIPGTLGSLSGILAIRLSVTYSMDQSGDGNS